MQHLGVGLRNQATLRVLTEDVLKTSEIEGEQFNPALVRSLLARGAVPHRRQRPAPDPRRRLAQ